MRLDGGGQFLPLADLHEPLDALTSWCRTMTAPCFTWWVAVTTNGQAVAQWLHPEGNPEPLPRAQVVGDAIRVTFAPYQLFREDRVHADTLRPVHFTVAFSDSDRPTDGQQTLVASSELTWGVPPTFGWLLMPRHPAGGVRIGDWKALIARLAPK